MKIVYFGFNSFRSHKRGVENVIDFQSKSFPFERIYYICWGPRTEVYKEGKLCCLSIKHCWYWPIFLNLILLRLKSRGQLIIHSHNQLMSFISLYKSDILTVHDGVYYLNRCMKKKRSLLLKMVEIFAYKKSKLIHFISIFTKNQSLFSGNKRFVIIPNTSHFEPRVKATVSKSNRNGNGNGNGNGNCKVLIVRSIEERARFDLLLDVAEDVAGRKYTFYVAGKGPLLEFYKDAIANRNIENIHLLGYTKDVDLLNLYADSDLLMMIAEYGEGFGLPVIEGYLFNKPVIASNRCAIPEVIICHDYLFENSTSSIIEKMNFAMMNGSLDFKSFYDENFSNKIILGKMRALYMECCYQP